MAVYFLKTSDMLESHIPQNHMTVKYSHFSGHITDKPAFLHPHCSVQNCSHHPLKHYAKSFLDVPTV